MEICSIYRSYFGEIGKLCDFVVQGDKQLQFEFQGIEKLLDAPLQRLIELRFFLLQILKCGQHACNQSPCPGMGCSIEKALRIRCNSGIDELSVLISEIVSKRGLQDSFKEILAFEGSINTSTCKATQKKGDAENYNTVDYPFVITIN